MLPPDKRIPDDSTHFAFASRVRLTGIILKYRRFSV
jgi:hypothetical protein